MTTTATPLPVADSSAVVITRDFRASRELVFRAWSTAEHLLRWHAPEGCVLTISHLEFREHGTFLTCISNPAFGECWCRGTYHEIREPEKIVYTLTTVDAQGNPVDPAVVGHDAEWPRETTVTVTFEEVAGQTRLTLIQSVSETLARKTGAYPSWLQMLDRLAQHLSDDVT